MMRKYSEEEIKGFQEKFLGKRIKINYEGYGWIGTCNFIGYNENLPSHPLQVTVNRTPLFPLESLEEISLEVAASETFKEN